MTRASSTSTSISTSTSTSISSWLAAAALALTVPAAACDPVPDPVASVDPFIGTGGDGHVYPGATVPHGMVQLSPDNGRDGPDRVAGYHASDSVMVGFAHTHVSGAELVDLSDILVMPGVVPSADVPDLGGPWEAPLDRPFADLYRHTSEEAVPGYYRVELERSGIGVELTATTRTGLHRYTFPDSVPAALLVDLGYSVNRDRTVAGELRLVSDTLLVGTRHSTGWATDQRVHFAAAFSSPVTDAIFFAGDSAGVHRLPSDTRAAIDQVVRVLLRFGTRDQPLVARIGISHTDQASAVRNLASEAGGRQFDEVRTAARAAWRDELGRVRVAGGTEAQARLFYTSLYRVHLGPVRYDDADGPDASPTRARYSIFDLWGTFRAQHPLLTIVSPERQPGIFHSLLGLRRELGYLPARELLGSEIDTVPGYHAAPVLADLILKGWGGDHREEALVAMVETAERDGIDVGPRRPDDTPTDSTPASPESVARALEVAYDDATIARVAALLAREAGEDADADRFDALADRFAERSRSWTEVVDSADSTGDTVRQQAWFVPHDPGALIRRLGGDAPFIARLDAFFGQAATAAGGDASADSTGGLGQYDQGSASDHHVPWLYVYAGAPSMTHRRVRQILDTLYQDTADGLPGTEGYGQLSAWYVLAAMGLYPVDPVGGVYVLGSPIFDEVEIDVGDGRTFRIEANNAFVYPYVVGARLNGEPWPSTWITHDQLTAGGVLELEMAADPHPAYGRAPEHRPPSLGAWWEGLDAILP